MRQDSKKELGNSFEKNWRFILRLLQTRNLARGRVSECEPVNLAQPVAFVAKDEVAAMVELVVRPPIRFFLQRSTYCSPTATASITVRERAL